MHEAKSAPCSLVGIGEFPQTKYQNEKIALISNILVFHKMEMHVYSYTRASKDSGKSWELLKIKQYNMGSCVDCKSIFLFRTPDILHFRMA